MIRSPDYRFQLASKRLIGMSAWLSIVSVVASLLIGGSSVFAMSPRSIAYPIGMGMGVLWLYKHADAKLVKQVCVFIGLHILYATWLFAMYLLKGQDLAGTIHKLASTHGLSVFLFVLLLPVVSNSKTRSLLLKFVAGSIYISLLIAFLQWLNINWAWRLAEVVNPRFIPLWGASIAGLGMNSIALGYQLLVLNSLVVGWAIASTPISIHKRKFQLVLIFMIAISAISLQSRSVAIASVFIVIVFIWNEIVAKNKPINECPSVLWFSLFCAMLSATVIFSPSAAEYLSDNLRVKWINQTVIADAHGIELEEYSSNHLRFHAIKSVLESIDSWEELIVGPSFDKYRFVASRKYPSISSFPHNLFFNAILIGGVVALFFSIFVICYHIKILLANRNDTSDITLLVIYLALLFNSMFHNDSVLFGSIYPIFAVAVAFLRPSVCVRR